MFVNQTILKEKQLIHTKHESKERATVCKSIELLNQMKSLGAELVKQFDYLQKELKRCERIRQDILHKIENSDDLNAPNSYNYTKALKVISQYRRKIKNELSAIEPHMEVLGKHYRVAGSEELQRVIKQNRSRLQSTRIKPRRQHLGTGQRLLRCRIGKIL